MKRAINFILLVMCALTAWAQAGEWVTITNGKLWYDNDSNLVQAHAPGFVRVGDTWYMVGEDRGNSWNPDVNMYSSRDLVHWKFEAKVIKNGVTHPDLGKTRFIERPKILYCKKTGQYVIWCHWEGEGYRASEAAVFYSDNITGPYKFYKGGRPLNIKSRDCNVFQDEDGTAYFVSTIEENQHIGLFRLSDDYLEPKECTILFEGQQREAPAIAHIDGLYYMLSSACTGWNPNQCKLSSSKYINKEWTPLTDIGDRIAFHTQADNILTIRGTKQTTYLYVGDRWMDPDLPHSKTIIFPVTFKDGKCEFVYHPKFEINYTTGEWRDLEPAVTTYQRPTPQRRPRPNFNFGQQRQQ